MQLREFVGYLPGVKGGGDQYSALCPAHDDRRQSLSVSSGADGRILLNCHADCPPEDIVAAMGLTMTDLFPEREKPPIKPQSGQSIVYDYFDADCNLVCQKTRYGDKSFAWRRPDGKEGGYLKGRGGIEPPLFNLPAINTADCVYLVEGEKDVSTLTRYGRVAVSLPDGAKSKWRDSYTEALRNKHVAIIPDNDEPGQKMAVMCANSLHGAAKSVKLLDLTRIWPELPEKGDVTDLLEHLGDTGMEAISKLVDDTPEYNQETLPVPKSISSLIKSLDQYEEQDATWIIDGWIPEGQISTLASDGGVGKTTLTCNIIAAFSNGTACLLDEPGTTRREMKVALLTTEDSIRKKLKRKLRLAGAKLENIIAPDFAADRDGVLRKLKFGTKEMSDFIRTFKPDFCVFDPIQGFLPPQLNMGSRNEMRDCLAPLISLGEDCKTTFLILCHTNKRKGAYGRDRIADSADLWDISRSVMMAGFTEEDNVRYLSNEKNNYTRLQESILFTIDDHGQIQRHGTSWKRDREYIQGETLSASKAVAPKREDCKEYILKALTEAGGAIRTAELEEKAKEYGYTQKTLRNAKEALKADGKIEYYCKGKNRDKVWYTRLGNIDGFIEMPSDTPIPWNESEQTTLTPSDI